MGVCHGRSGDVLSELGAVVANDEGVHTEDGVVLVCADNWRFVPDSSVDLVLTDPPYNIARDTNFHTWSQNTISSFRFDASKGWDSHTPDVFQGLLGSWAAEMGRVLRPGGSFAVFCSDRYVSHLMGALSGAGLKPRRMLTWRKPNPMPTNRAVMMMSACEYAVVGVKGSGGTFRADVPVDDVSEFFDVEAVLIADKPLRQTPSFRVDTGPHFFDSSGGVGGLMVALPEACGIPCPQTAALST